MDRKHQLDAPDNDTLKTIEQLDDRSGLTTIYPHAQDQWDGNIMTTEARETKQAKELSAITLSIRKWAVPVGVLAIAPIVSASLLAAVALTYVTEDNASLLLFPMMIITGIWGLVSFAAIKKLYGIFYGHALQATPFFVMLLVLMGLAVQSIYIVTRPIQNGSFIFNTAVISGVALAVSAALSWILLVIWTNRRIAGNVKLGLIGVIAFILLAVATVATIA